MFEQRNDKSSVTLKQETTRALERLVNGGRNEDNFNNANMIWTKHKVHVFDDRVLKEFTRSLVPLICQSRDLFQLFLLMSVIS